MSPAQRDALVAAIQDPPPEPSWGWRRGLTWFITVVSLALVGGMIWKLAPGMAGVGIAYGLIGLVGWTATLYLVGPSADEVARIFAQGARLIALVPQIMRPNNGYTPSYDGRSGYSNGSEGMMGIEQCDGPPEGHGDGQVRD